MKKVNTVVGSFMLLLLSITAFLWFKIPYNVIQNIGQSLSLLVIIKTIIYYIAFGYILVTTVNSIMKPGEKLPFKKKLIAIVLILLTEIVFDFVNLMISFYIGYYSIIITDVCTLVELLVFFLICLKITGNKVESRKRLIIAVAVSLVALLTVAVALDLMSVKEYVAFDEKYEFTLGTVFNVSQTDTYSAFLSNQDFAFAFRNTLISGCFLITLLVSLCLFGTSKEEAEEEKSVNRRRLASRLMATLLFLPIVCVLVIVAIPHGSVYRFEFPSVRNNSMGYNLDSSYTTTIIERGVGYGKSKEVYCKTNLSLYFDKELLGEFSVDGKYLHPVEGTMIGDVNVVTYADCRAVGYVLNDTLVYYDLADLSGKDSDEYLIAACEEFWNHGFTNIIEYAGEYMLKYDYDFTMPYIERYSKGDYNEEEISNFNGINPNYITKIALQLLDANN